jgi:Xaa-Pro aminopeptidase
MYQYFDKSFFAGNRTKLRRQCGDDAPIVIAANGRMQKSADIAFAFHQDSNFWYLTGLNEPEAVLVIDTKETYVILPEMSDYLSYFYGQSKQETIQDISRINKIYGAEDGWGRLNKRVKQTKKAYSLTPPPSYMDVYGMYTNPTRQDLFSKLKDTAEETEIIDVRQELALMRMIKQPSELKALQAAVDLTVDAFKYVGKQSFKTEKEIEAAFSIYFLQHGQHDHAYDPIVAAGHNACLMHTSSTRARMIRNNIVLIDIGVEVDSYAADITRIITLDPPTKRQKEVYDAVLATQQFAISNIKPGISIRENEKLVEQFIGEQMVQLGIIKKPERESIRHYFPHATSHFLGRDVHDLGDYDAPLAENMVLTIEPGIYIPEESIGIRIEDDILVTKDGCRIMSDALPRTLK